MDEGNIELGMMNVYSLDAHCSIVSWDIPMHLKLRPSVLFASFSNPHIESPEKKKIGAYTSRNLRIPVLFCSQIST